MEKIIRHRYFVNKAFQLRFISFVIVPLIVVMVALYSIIYYSVFNEILIPEAIATTLLPAMKKVNIIIAVGMPIFLLILLRTILIYSNRIIGPLARLEKQLDKAISGDYSARIKARNKDELKSLIDKINMLLEKIDHERKA